MKVTVIGHWGGYPGTGEATSGYLIQEGNYNFLLDCGSAVVSNLQRYLKLEELHSVITSHYHFDHIADIGVLQYSRLIQGINSDNSNTLEIYGHGYDAQGLSSLSMKPYTIGKRYDESRELSVGPFRVSFCKTQHPAPCFAMRIKSNEGSIVYTADTSYFEELVEFCKNADLIISECNLYSHQSDVAKRIGHMTSSDAGRLARDSGAGKLLLTHLPHFGDKTELLREAEKIFLGKVELASLGWIWNSSN